MTPADTRGLLDGLTPAQRGAVTHIDGPLLVLAGPGSGKTRVITHRVAHLVHNGIPPWQILALTFTNKAAAEMRDRLDALIPPDLAGRRGLTVATFHAFCVRLLRRYADAANLASSFTIYDSADQRDALKQAMGIADMDTRHWTPAAVAASISEAKNRLLDAAQYTEHAHDFRARQIARAFTAYERILHRNDAVDFDDLLTLTCRVLRNEATVRHELQERYQYVLIDEYQDTNHAQFVIAHTLAAEHRNICVVGDPDQSIYAWRGADISNILEFEQHYGDATVIPLGQNFRSTERILTVASHLIKNNEQRRHKDLYSELGEGDRPEYAVCRDEHHEADLVVDFIRRRHDDLDIPWRETAILYRMNALSRVLEDAFRRAQIPYVIARGTAFYERKEIKDALAYLRVVANPNDEVSLRRIINTPTRGIGKTTLEKVEIAAINRQERLLDSLREASSIAGLSSRAVTAIRKFVTMVDAWRAMASGNPDGMLIDPGDALADLVGRVVKESGLESAFRKSTLDEDQQRLENLGELVSAAAEFVPIALGDLEPVTDWTLERRLQAYLESVALVADADMVDPANGAVTLMTLHAAKGLEFDTIAIVGLEESILPHSRSAESDAQLEEERRLLFVGITRAKRALHLSRAAVRTVRGMRNRTMESQFFRELPGEELVSVDLAGYDDGYEDPRDRMSSRMGFDRGNWSGRSVNPGADAPDVVRKYPPGCLVRHPMFGRGRVEEIEPRPTKARARVLFESVGMKTLILEYARLEVIDAVD